jgi:hypothetical protein
MSLVYHGPGGWSNKKLACGRFPFYTVSMSLTLPYKAGQLMRVRMREAREAEEELRRGRGLRLGAPITVSRMMVSSPCCACKWFSRAYGAELMRQLGGRGILREAGVARAVADPDLLGRCRRDGNLCDPFATCRHWRLGNYVSPEAAAVEYTQR